MATFTKLWQHYKDNFDLELRLRLVGVTYEELKARMDKSEAWL